MPHYFFFISHVTNTFVYTYKLSMRLSQKVKIEKTMWHGDMMTYSIMHMISTNMQLLQLSRYLNGPLE